MKHKHSFFNVLTLMLFLGVASCSKDSPAEQAQDSSEITVHADDEAFFTGETDALFTDINEVLDDGYSSGRIQDNIVCDASVAIDLLSNPQKITITFNGENCVGNKTREGSIVLSAPAGTRWQEAGAAFTIEYKNFKVTRKSDKKSITINGEQTFTNESGGLLLNLASLESVTHLVTSKGLDVTFSNGAKRSWFTAQKRVFTYDNGMVLSVSGTHTENNDKNVAVWGTNRFGTAFTSIISEPLVIRQDCNFRLTGGTIVHKVGSASATATFGLDKEGKPVTCPSGNYYYKLVWTGPNGNSLSILVAY